MNQKQNTTSWFTFTTLTSKILLVLGFFCVFVTIFSVLFFIQSFQNYNYLYNYKEYGLKLQENLYDLRKYTIETALQQKAFIITQNPACQEKRLALWKHNIYPTLNSINDIDKTLISKKMPSLKKEILENVFIEIKKFENLQFEITQDYNILWEKNITIDETTYNKNLGRLEAQRGKITNTIQKLIDKQNTRTNKMFDSIYFNTLYALYITLFFTFSLLILVLIFGQLIYFQIKKAIKKTTLFIDKIIAGVAPPPVTLHDDEFDDVLIGLNAIAQHNTEVSIFAKKIGAGDFDATFVSASQEDILGQSLLQMQAQLKKAEIEDNKQNWVTEGLAKFAEIIRANNKDLYTLTDAVLIELIAYMNANQGGFFIANPQNDNTIKLNMMACWAYDRKKFLQKEIIIQKDNAEGLLGEAFLEQNKIVITDIPESYINITSGLGEGTPKHLLIIPIKSTNNVEGILEIASFHHFEEYQISFVEKLCESLASAIIVIKNLEQTHFLLGELKIQTTAMQNQEIELRENVMRLNETQAEMQEKQTELENLKSSLQIEVRKRTQDLQGSLIRFDLLNQTASEGLWDMVIPENNKLEMDTPFFWSPQLVKSLGYEPAEFPDILNSWMSKLHPEDAETVFKEFIAHLKDHTGETAFLNEHRLLTKSGEYRWFKARAITLRDAEGKAVRIAGYINDVTHIKELDAVMKALQSQKEELEKNKEELEMSNRKMQSNQLVLKKAFEKMKTTEAIIKEKNKQLEESLQLLDDIENNSPSIIYKFFSDMETGKASFVFVSKAVTNLLGYTSEEYMGFDAQKLTETLHPEDQKSYFKAYFHSLNNIDKFFWQGRMKHKDGHWVWIQSQSTPRKLTETTRMSIGSFIDIQQLKENEIEITDKTQQILASEEELRQNMEELQATQEAMQDKQKEVQEANQKLTQREQILKKALEKTKENQSQLKKTELQYQEILQYLLGDVCLFEENGKIITLSKKIIEEFLGTDKSKNLEYFYQKYWDDLNTSHNWQNIMENKLTEVFLILPNQNAKLSFEKISLNDKNVYLGMVMM